MKARAGQIADQLFKFFTSAAGITIFIILFAIGAYLIAESMPAIIGSDGSSTNTGWKNFTTYLAPLLVGTLLAAGIAILIAAPLAIAVALYLSHYSPRKIAKPLGYLVDTLAAIPSVVYGAWGLAVLAPAMVPAYSWLSENLGWIPFFYKTSNTGRTLLTAALVLAVMILPIITAQCREIFIQTPQLSQEGALALGSTKWDMIKACVFPFAKNGIISAIMLGLGRALGETMAVTMVLSPGAFTWVLTASGNKTIPAEIALNYPEAFGSRYSELIATGLILFAVTLLVNLAANWVSGRYRQLAQVR